MAFKLRLCVGPFLVRARILFGRFAYATRPTEVDRLGNKGPGTIQTKYANERIKAYVLMAASQSGRSEQPGQRLWHEKYERNIKTGIWLPEEDQRLREAVARHGGKWVLVAADVGSRTGDQCFKRWNDALNPDLDHSPWSAEEDHWLQDRVDSFGRNWKSIAAVCEKKRSTLALKNRYSLLQRRKAISKRKYNRSRPGSGAPSRDGSDDTSLLGSELVSDYDGDGEGTIEDKSSLSGTDTMPKSTGYVFDPDLLNWNLNATIGMQQDLPGSSAASTFDARKEGNQEQDFSCAFPWSDLGFANANTPDFCTYSTNTPQKDGKSMGSGYIGSCTPASRSGYVTPAINPGYEDERVIVTAHCPKEKLSSLMEAMMGVVDSVAVGRPSDGSA